MRAAASYSPPALVFPVTAASMKSFRAKDGSGDDHGEPWEGGRNGGRDFRRTALSFGRWAVHRYAWTSIRAAKNTEGILQSKGGQRPRCFLGWPSGCHCRRKQGGFGVQRQSFVEGLERLVGGNNALVWGRDRSRRYRRHSASFPNGFGT